MGDAFIDNDRTLFKADIGGTYTIQQDVEPTPGKEEGFGGIRAGMEFNRALSETTEFLTTLIADENLSDTEDLRLDGVASISVTLVDGLALKTSYRMLFDNQPALLSVPLGRIGDSASITPLVDLLEDEGKTASARAFAAVALGIVADQDELPWNTILSVDLNYNAAPATLYDQAGFGILNIL